MRECFSRICIYSGNNSNKLFYFDCCLVNKKITISFNRTYNTNTSLSQVVTRSLDRRPQNIVFDSSFDFPAACDYDVNSIIDHILTMVKDVNYKTVYGVGTQGLSKGTKNVCKRCLQES
uniref:Uncharacterized protein n=1 Tax=Homalodisca liturata TaxID=320908 RepID=A0A1B6HRU7_9HEMI